MVNKNLKICTGCLYYSSSSKSPVCYGYTSSHEAGNVYEREVKSLDNFMYACVGCSYYKRHNSNTPTKIPDCKGLEILAVEAAAPPPPNKPDGKELPQRGSPAIPSNSDGKELPQRRSPTIPTNSDGNDFLSRFARNANVVANGVAKNMRRVGNQIKQELDDAMNAYRRRPK